MQYFEIGNIVNTQGIKGEVRIYPTTDEPERFRKLKEIVVFLKNKEVSYEIENLRYHKKFVILKLRGIETMNDAEALRGGVIRVDSKDAIDLKPNEYFIRDLYDMDVVDDKGSALGVLSDIIFTGANDVYVVKSQGRKDLLIPAIKQCILRVDTEKKIMTVRLLEGLMEE